MAFNPTFFSASFLGPLFVGFQQFDDFFALWK